MTNEKLKEVLKFYENYLTNLDNYWKPERMDVSRKSDEVGQQAIYNHLLWMCQNTLSALSIMTSPRATETSREGVEGCMRWLGFIQGALFMLGDFTIDELREHSSSK